MNQSWWPVCTDPHLAYTEMRLCELQRIAKEQNIAALNVWNGEK